MRPVTLHLAAVGRPGQDGTLLVDVSLSSRLQPRPGMPVHPRLHSHGTVVLAGAAPAEERATVRPPAGVTFDDAAIYRVFFHGPAYRVLEGVHVDGGSAVGVMREALPPNARDPEADERTSPRLVELCFQTAGMLDVARRSAFGLPAALRSVRLTGAARPEGVRLYAEVHPGDDGGLDARVVDADGRVHVVLSGYRTVALPSAQTLAELHESVADVAALPRAAGRAGAPA
jgi:hypothetical protein